jgi:hypothetical protein
MNLWYFFIWSSKFGKNYKLTPKINLFNLIIGLFNLTIDLFQAETLLDW